MEVLVLSKLVKGYVKSLRSKIATLIIFGILMETEGHLQSHQYQLKKWNSIWLNLTLSKLRRVKEVLFICKLILKFKNPKQILSSKILNLIKYIQKNMEVVFILMVISLLKKDNYLLLRYLREKTEFK